MQKQTTDPFLQLFRVNKQLDTVKNNLRIYQQKHQKVKRNFLLKKKRMKKYQSQISHKKTPYYYQNSQHYNKEINFQPNNSKYRSRLFTKIIIDQNQNQRCKTADKMKGVDQSFQENQFNKDSKSMHCNTKISERQKYDNFIRLRSMQRRIERKQNQQKKQEQYKTDLMLKKTKKREIEQFQKGVAKKRESFLQNYINSIKMKEKDLSISLDNQKINESIQIKKLMKQKKGVLRSIQIYKMSEKRLYDQYIKKLKARNGNVLDWMIKSMIIP